jgi:DNA replication initiation complex subunit (GINS family)
MKQPVKKVNDKFRSRYKKRRSVEEYHKIIKRNASVASSPARSVTGQSNHLFASVFAFIKLEKIKLSKNLNLFGQCKI